MCGTEQICQRREAFSPKKNLRFRGSSGGNGEITKDEKNMVWEISGSEGGSRGSTEKYP